MKDNLKQYADSVLKDAVEEAVGEVMSKTFPFSHTKASPFLSRFLFLSGGPL